MQTDVKTYASRLRQTPAKACNFSVGDVVTYTNEYGVSFPGMRVIGFADDDSFYGRFIHLVGPEYPGAYWFPHKPDELIKES